MAPPITWGAPMTVAEIVEAALRKIGVVGHGQVATAEQAASGAQAFNLMIHAWGLDGIDLSLSPDDLPLSQMADYAAATDPGIPSALIEGTIYCLAARLAPEYSVAVQFDDEAFKAKLRNALRKDVKAIMEPALQRGAVYSRWVL